MNAAAAVVGFVFVLTSLVLLDAVAAASAISCPAGVVPLTNALFAVPGTSRVHAIGYCDANGGPVNYYYVISTNGGVDFSAAHQPFPSSAIVDGPMGIVEHGKYVVIAGRQPSGTNVTVAVSINNGPFAAVVLPFYTNPDALTVTSAGEFLVGDELSAVYASTTPEVASSWTASHVGPRAPWSGVTAFAENATGALLAVGTVPVGFDVAGMVFVFDAASDAWLPIPNMPVVGPLLGIATNGTAVVVSAGNSLMTSFDGATTWATTQTVKNGDIWGVSYDAAARLWSAAAESTVFVSRDAVLWTATPLPGHQLVFMTASSNGTLVAGGGGPTPLLVSLTRGAKWMPARIH
jgi:hypothetical protein